MTTLEEIDAAINRKRQELKDLLFARDALMHLHGGISVQLHGPGILQPQQPVQLPPSAEMVAYSEKLKSVEERAPGKVVVHVLHEGMSLCRLPGVPAQWPAGHKWVGLDSSVQATCVDCCQALVAKDVRKSVDQPFSGIPKVEVTCTPELADRMGWDKEGLNLKSAEELDELDRKEREEADGEEAATVDLDARRQMIAQRTGQLTIGKPVKGKRRSFTPEFKLQILDEIKATGKTNAVLAKHGISASLLIGWRKQLEKGELGPSRTSAPKVQGEPFTAAGDEVFADEEDVRPEDDEVLAEAAGEDDRGDGGGEDGEDDEGAAQPLPADDDEDAGDAEEGDLVSDLAPKEVRHREPLPFSEEEGMPLGLARANRTVFRKRGRPPGRPKKNFDDLE